MNIQESKHRAGSRGLFSLAWLDWPRLYGVHWEQNENRLTRVFHTELQMEVAEMNLKMRCIRNYYIQDPATGKCCNIISIEAHVLSEMNLFLYVDENYRSRFK